MSCNRALTERIWTMFNSWRLSTSQISRGLLLDEETVKMHIAIKWQEVTA